MREFTGKIAVVTGGASGLGKEICGYLAERGATVIIADKNEEAGRAAAADISSRTDAGSAKAALVDVADYGSVKTLFTNVVSEYGWIDYLFNNAGVGINGEFQDMTFDHWRRLIDVNLWGVINGCRSVYPVMMKQGHGHIINVSSLAGLIPGGLMAGYSAAKHAVVGFTLTLRAEAKQYGIKVSALCPGFMQTPIHEASLTVSEFMKQDKFKPKNDGRYPTPEECINRMMRGVVKNKVVIVSPLKHKTYWWLYRVLPGAIPFMWEKIIAHMKRGWIEESIKTE